MHSPQHQLPRPNYGEVGSILIRSLCRAHALALLLVVAMEILGAAYASVLHAQQQPTDTSQDTTEAVRVLELPSRASPTGALVRSFLIPGWGQAVSGATERGAVYFTFESLGLWMILKTSKTLGSARDIYDMRRRAASDRLIASGTVNPLAAAIDADLPVLSALNLVKVREQQREDWMAFGVFALLLGGADAFVAAHLADFPEPLEAAIRPLPDMGVEFGFRWFAF